uniref:Membrane transport protein MMPL domain-containing protein n=1 Tax=Desulfobacca acetoxidans TaxID=60893 RepID=A0A7C3ZDF8_9BACT
MAEAEKDLLKHCSSTFLNWVQRRYWWIIGAALVLCALSIYYAKSSLTIQSSTKNLISSDLRLIKLTEEMDKAFGGRDGLVVVVKNQEKSRSIAFAEALATELRRYPGNFTELFYRLNPDVFKPWALLFLGQNDLADLKKNLVGQEKLLAGLARDPRLVTFYGLVNRQLTEATVANIFTGFLEVKEKPALPNVALLNASLDQLARSLKGRQPYVSPFDAYFPSGISDLSQQGYFFTPNNKFLIFMVTQKPGEFAESTANLKLLRKTVTHIQTRFPGLEAGVTGADALNVDQMSGSMQDITLATWISLAGQFALLVLFLRGLRRPLVEVLSLIIGLFWVFGMVTLVVGHLNLLSVIFAPLMLGLSIDYGIHWFCRLEEEEWVNQRRCTPEALSCAYRQSLPGIACAALAAMLSFLPLALVNFRGLAELGLILTLGIAIMVLATLVMAPCLVLATQKCVSTGKPHKCPGQPRPFLHLRRTRPELMVTLGAIIVGLGIFSFHQVRFDLNPLHLQNPHSQSVLWEMKLLEESRYSTTFAALTAPSLAELKTKSATLEKLPTIAHVESVLSFLPAQVQEKRPVIEALAPTLNTISFPRTISAFSAPQELADILGRINFKMDEAAKHLEKEKAATAAQIAETHTLINKIMPMLDPTANPQVLSRLRDFESRFFADLHDKWNLLRSYEHSALTSPPMTTKDLPETVRVRFIHQGTYLIQAFPSQDIWNFGPLKRFVDSVWKVDPNAVGDPVLLYVFTTGFRNSILWATGMAVMIITAMLVIFYRSLMMAMLALIPLWVGTSLTLFLMWLTNLPFNQANVLFLPLILGEGIEFGIIILTRWQLEESARDITLPASTAKGVALAALTTTVGFGSLMVSADRGTFSLGLLATIGSLSVLLASLSILPAFLKVMRKRLRPGAFRFYSLLGSPEVEPEAPGSKATDSR